MAKIDPPIGAIGPSMGNTTVFSADTDLSTVPRPTIDNWRAT